MIPLEHFIIVETYSSLVFGLAQNMSTLKYCSTLEIVFVHFREDFENLILELGFFTCQYALYLLEVHSIKPKPLIQKQNLHRQVNFSCESLLMLQSHNARFICQVRNFFSQTNQTPVKESVKLLHQTWSNFAIFQKGLLEGFLVVQNCIKNGSRNIYLFLLKKVIGILRSIYSYCVSTEQYLK